MSVHGTPRGYDEGCRQPCCRAAHAARARARRRAVAYGQHTPRSVPNIGARRRVEALMRLGWSMRQQSRMLGWHADRLTIMFNNQRGISPANLARITALYDRLWNVTPQQTTKGERVSVRRTVALAERQGFQPPLAWDDDEIDNPDARPHVHTGSSPWDHKPCGTIAAARRHYRRGEPLDAACRAASNRNRRERSAA